MSNNDYYYAYKEPSINYVLRLFNELLRNKKARLTLIVALLAVFGTFMILTNIGETISVDGVFVGHNIQGYGFYTYATFNVSTDSMTIGQTDLIVYHFSFGTWRPAFDYKDSTLWYTITYQETLLGKKLLHVEPS